MTADISRAFADRNKLFRSVVRQQGRLPTDAEENHSSEIADWEHDAEFTDVIAPLGSPDNGFRIEVPSGANGSINILSGSFYLGGARIENPAVLDYAAQKQGNWLTQTEAIAPGTKIFVWLEAEERAVTAFEDAELFEPALGGPDGAARKRFVWRVRQRVTTKTDCTEALAELTAPLGDAFDSWTGRVASAGTLTVGFDDTDVDLDLCHPAIQAGYLGNRNNCFRIKVIDATHFVWAEDDASQLYRVQVAADRHTVTFLNQPRDEYLRPRQNDVIEMLRGDVLLPNFQRIAEMDGAWFQAASDYSAGKIVLNGDIDATWPGWLAGVPIDPDPALTNQRFYHARIWRGKETFTPGTPVTLTGTGLTMTFNGPVLPGESWVCAARPDAPSRVLPWALAGGMRAHAPRRHVAGLALVDLATGKVTDCRQRFRPLYRLRSCCTVTVGPQGSRRADVDSIAAAVALLPDSGGKICLLPGTHRANIALDSRRDIHFDGCSGQTRWLPEIGREDEPLVELDNCSHIRFSGVDFEDGTAGCIVADRDPGAPLPEPGSDLVIERCHLLAHSGCAVLGRNLAGAEMRSCRVTAGPLLVAPPAGPNRQLAAVFLSGEDLIVAETRVHGASGHVAPSRIALGGIQIGGGSRRVFIRDCEILGGSGIGITLGSINWIPVMTSGSTSHVFGAHAHGAMAMAPRFAKAEYGYSVRIDVRGCIGISTVPPPPPEIETPLEIPFSAGQVEDVLIERNRIEDMGSNGIATYPFGPLISMGNEEAEIGGDAIAVERIAIIDNIITRCAQLEAPGDETGLARLVRASGGIVLSIAIDVLIRGNEIVLNGFSGAPAVCGVAVTYGEDLRIIDNRIEKNGEYVEAGGLTGPNAGVNVMFAAASLAVRDDDAMFGSDRLALYVHGNIIAAPAGRAIRALTLGPIMIDDNRLIAGNPARIATIFSKYPDTNMLAKLRGSGVSNAATFLLIADLILDLLGGDAVNLVNLAVGDDYTIPRPKYAVGTPAWSEGMAGMQKQQTIEPPGGWQRGGEIMFANNQVSLRRPYPRGPQWTICSILILSLDDIAFVDNQYEVERSRYGAIFDALLAGMTIRATSNRGQEGVVCWLSILSWALLHNMSSLNQTTMPIVTAGTNTIDTNNWSLN